MIVVCVTYDETGGGRDEVFVAELEGVVLLIFVSFGMFKSLSRFR